MRILSLTAGAAGMYCGSCLRDNALAAELLRRGYDVLLLPLYTPTRTDEPNVSAPRVFFGGLNVYLQQRSGLFRRTPWLVDRLLDSRLAFGLAARRSVSVTASELGELTVSILAGHRGRQRKEFQKLIQWLGREAPPDLIVLPNALLISLAEPLKTALKRPVCCTLQGEDLFLEGLGAPHRQAALDAIRRHARHVDAFLAVSEYYVEFMTGYLGLPRDKVHFVPIGIRLDGHRGGPRPRSPRGASPEEAPPLVIGYFARIAPEKGLHLLAEAYHRLRARGALGAATLEAAGYLAAEHTGYLREIEQRMAAWGLAGEFRYHGPLDREGKIAFLERLDLFSVPCPYAEPKGIFALEAMANGLAPVVPRHGVFPEMQRRTAGLVLVDPNDAGALADALERLARDPDGAAALGRAGAEGVRRHYSVEAMADRALEVFRAVVGS